ncbi:hypothetical protein VQ042_13550 [Aurantimonas sp. A2-1-M11]
MAVVYALFVGMFVYRDLSPRLRARLSRDTIKNRRSIHDRPAEVEDRRQVGHEAFSRGEDGPRKRGPSSGRGLSPEERRELDVNVRRATAKALSGSVNKLTLIGIVTKPPTVKRTGIIDVLFDMATWEAGFVSGDVTHHSVSVKDERLFELVENGVSPGTRGFVEGTLRRAGAIASLGMSRF